MGMKDKVTVKLLQATSDKTELNKKALQWKKSFVEVNKTLGTSSPKTALYSLCCLISCKSLCRFRSFSR